MLPKADQVQAIALPTSRTSCWQDHASNGSAQSATQGEAMRVDASPDAGADATHDAAAMRSERMRALANRRWQAQREDRARERDADEAAADAVDATSATTAVDLVVVRELERKAQRGDIAAAKELREWRRRDPAEGADADSLRMASIIVRLPRKLRNELRQWLLDHENSP